MNDYEKKYIEFYNKFSVDSDKAKDKLETYANELEHVYTLSQSIINSNLKKEWEIIWEELTAKPPYDNNNPFKSSISRSLYRKQKRTIEKYLLFFHTEYNRIKEKSQ